MLNYYKILNVDPKAVHEVISAAYHALALKFRDDNKRMVSLNEAKSILLNNDKRLEYDKDRIPSGKKVIGDYRILEKIAEGGFGITYKAEHIVLGTLVCIKHAINVSANDELILKEEAKNIWDLRHWGIPAIRNIINMPDGSLSLVMSYVPGPTLAEIIEDKKHSLDAESVAWITERLLNILRYLHMSGVVHGDIKPQNIIVQEESHTITLVDYGLSSLKPNSKTEAKGFTPYFAAPEQSEGKVPIPESDLYGLGMTMIYALGGDVEYCKVPSDTPEELCLFIKKLIKRNPFSRPKIWTQDDLCDVIKDVRMKCFGRVSSGMKKIT